MFIRMFFLLWHFFPHFWSYLSDFGTPSNIMLFRNFIFLLIVVKKETGRWTFRFMYTFKSLFKISLRRSSFLRFLFIIFSNHNWKFFITLQLNEYTFLSRWFNLIINFLIILILLHFDLLKLVFLSFSLYFNSSCLICFNSFYLFKIFKDLFILALKLLHTSLVSLSRCLRKLFIRNFLLICHLSPSFRYSFSKGWTISELFWCF